MKSDQGQRGLMASHAQWFYYAGKLRIMFVQAALAVMF